MNTIIVSLLVAAGLLAIPVAILCLEIIAAAVASGRQVRMPQGQSVRPRIAVLVPAHNESTGVLPALADIRQQLLPGDRLVVVADNCTDDTVAVAKLAGADVIERVDTTKRGKGYALDHGFRYLSFDPPDIVIVIDADCRIQPGSIEQLALKAAATKRPAQAINIVISPPTSAVNHQVAEFAGRVKRWVRPLGLSFLNLPCQLTGTGMAFPFEIARLADLTTGSIAEDLKLGLELSLAGHSPVFCPSACVTSEFPSSVVGTSTQRKRWEQGHIEMILKDAVRLLSLAFARRNWNLLALTLDFAVPPLSLLAMLISGLFAVTLVPAFLGFSSTPLIITTGTLFVFVASIFVAWLKCGRDILPGSSIFRLFTYVTGKFGLYSEILSGKSDAQWQRTDRKKAD